MSDKKVFMIADSDAELVKEVSEMLRKSFDATIYMAVEGTDALAKMRNVPPSLLVIGLDLGRMSAVELIRTLSVEKHFDHMPILVLSDLPHPKDAFVDDMAKGRMKFLSRPVEQDVLIDTVSKALQVTSHSGSAFTTRTLEPNEWLFREGEIADRAFLVRSGRLQASRRLGGNVVLLGDVLPGEFVGEMAHITGEPRSADVKALEPSELVEIPLGNLDLLLFSKPTWTKALLKTLCRRLREANLKKN
jgi:CRP/FNR family transcriptional regulator, cyclic AMP receptor protein